jgi:hypothetical protein
MLGTRRSTTKAESQIRELFRRTRRCFSRKPYSPRVVAEPLRYLAEPMLDIEPIERPVMQMLRAGDHPTLATLRQQFDQCDVSQRDFTGVGFFTSFTVRDCQLRIEPPTRIVLGDVCADIDGLESGCGFILFVGDGLLATLECHLWGDEAFPSNARYTRLYYVCPNPPSIAETKERDMEALNTKLRRKQSVARVAGSRAVAVHVVCRGSVRGRARGLNA